MEINRNLKMRKSPPLLHPIPLFQYSKSHSQQAKYKNASVGKRPKEVDSFLKAKKFYLPPNKKELSSLVQKRPGFILDCCRISEKKLPEYDGLKDCNLSSLFCRPIYKKHIDRLHQIVLELHQSSQGGCTPINRNPAICQSATIQHSPLKNKPKFHRAGNLAITPGNSHNIDTSLSINRGARQLTPLSSEQLKRVMKKYRVLNSKPIKLNSSFIYY